MAIGAITGYSFTYAATAAASVSSTSLYTRISDETKSQLQKLNIAYTSRTTEAEAKALIEKAEQNQSSQTTQATQQTQATGPSYYEKELISDVRNLAYEIGLSFSENDNMKIVLQNIGIRIAEIRSFVGDNEAASKKVDEFDGRYTNLAARYAAKEESLKGQLLASLDYAAVMNKAALGLV